MSQDAGRRARQPVPGLDAVLWDMDGTLVDTEPYWIEAEYALVAEFGGTWTDQDSLSVIGNPLLVTAQVLRDRGGVDMELVDIVDRLQSHVAEQVGLRTSWRPGAVELLAALGTAGVPCALVTMSWRSLADALVRQLPEGTFATTVTGDEVTHGKPHPEPYTTAVQRLGVRAERCVAIEDSVTGLTSAEAAGVATVGVPHLVPIPPAAGRTLVPSLEDVTVTDLVALVAGRDSVSEP